MTEFQATTAAPGGRPDAANGSSDNDTHHDECCDEKCLNQDAPGTLLSFVPSTQQRAPDQAGFPADRFANEDGGTSPRTLVPPSSLIGEDQNCSQMDVRPARAGWKLGQGPASNAKPDTRDITQLALDMGSVHEIKPAIAHCDHSDAESSNGGVDWAASWSAARSFCLALIARRLTQQRMTHRQTDDTIAERIRRPILWCLPRAARAEHGAPYIHGLQQYGLTPTDMLFAETSNTQNTLWTLEEGLKSDSLALVVGIIDDVELTPARRLATGCAKTSNALFAAHPSADATGWCDRDPLACQLPDRVGRMR